MKVRSNKDIYNFSIEFNRIESYNVYCVEWLSYYGIELQITSKTNWQYSDIPDIKDFNRIKSNINILINTLNIDYNNLNINTQFNQTFDYTKANEIEQRLSAYLKQLGEMQFAYNITGLTTTGNSLRLGGVN